MTRVKALTFIAVATAGVMALLSGPAAADAPTKETTSLIGSEVFCGTTVLTVTSGNIEETSHLHEKPNGLVQEVFHVRILGVRLADTAGNTYRAVGTSNGQFTFDPSIAEENGFGHFTQNVNILSRNGLFGTVRDSFHVNRQGKISERSTGTCTIPEEE